MPEIPSEWLELGILSDIDPMLGINVVDSGPLVKIKPEPDIPEAPILDSSVDFSLLEELEIQLEPHSYFSLHEICVRFRIPYYQFRRVIKAKLLHARRVGTAVIIDAEEFRRFILSGYLDRWSFEGHEQNLWDAIERSVERVENQYERYEKEVVAMQKRNEAVRKIMREKRREQTRQVRERRIRLGQPVAGIPPQIEFTDIVKMMGKEEFLDEPT